MDLSKITDRFSIDFSSFASPEFYQKVISIVLLVALVLVSFKVIQSIVLRLLKGRLSNQSADLVRKAIRYTGFVIALMTLFNQLGIDLSALLGAAGIVGIAVGFAAQTSVSNVISGLFLISEKPFAVGDAVQVGDVVGVVQSVDFLSIKIKTYDNRYVRIPNETIIKTNVVNVTRFPIRRLDVWVGVSYDTDLEHLMAVLKDVARDNVYALDNPEPLILLDKFDSSGINVLLGLWFEKSNYLNLKNSIMIDVKKRFDQERISIPFPQLDVRIASKTAFVGVDGPDDDR